MAIHTLYGCHPHYSDTFTSEKKASLQALLNSTGCVGLGEIGLDYSPHNTVCRDVQKIAFQAQLKIALDRQLPICFHVRDADEDGFEELEKVRFHKCFFTT